MELELFREGHLAAMAPRLADPDVLRFTLLPIPVPDDFLRVDNSASKRVAERAGYVRERVLRSVYFKRGMREDLEIWSRLPSDP